MASQGSELFYYFFPLVITLLALVGYRRTFTGKFILFLLLFFSMFRGDNVGNDTKNYMDASIIKIQAEYLDEYDNLTEWAVVGINQQLQLTYIGLNMLVYNLDLPPRTIIYAFSMIQMFFLYFAFKRMRVNTSLGFAFYVLLSLYFFSLSAARQIAAVSVFIYGVTFLFENNPKKYLFFLFAFLAITIHSSSILFIWLYLIRYLSINRKLLMYIMASVCLFMVVSSFDFMNIVYRIVNIHLVSGHQGQFDGVVRTSIISRMSDLIKYVFLIYLFTLRNREKKCDNWDLLYGLAVLLWALFSHTNGLLARGILFVTVFVAFYNTKVIICAKLLRNKQFLIVFYVYILVTVLGMRQWADALTSGYYLMF